MYETHHVAAIIAATFMFVVLGVSFVSEASLYDEQTESGAVSVIPRTAPTHSNPVGSANSAAIIAHAPVAPVATTSEVSPQIDIERELDNAAETEVAPVATAVPETIESPQLVPVKPTPTPTRSVSSTASDKNFSTQVAAAIHAATNAVRTDSGLSPLSYDTELATNATGYSKGLLRSGVLSHTDPSGCSMTCRFSASGYVAKAWGENLAVWESSYAPTVDEVVGYFISAWEKSDGHRDNLLSANFTHEGVGVAREGNTIYVTVHFAKP